MLSGQKKTDETAVVPVCFWKENHGVLVHGG